MVDELNRLNQIDRNVCSENANFESIFEKFVISKKMTMVDEVTIIVSSSTIDKKLEITKNSKIDSKFSRFLSISSSISSFM